MKKLLFLLISIIIFSCTKYEYVLIEKTDTLYVFVDSSNIAINDLSYFKAISDTFSSDQSLPLANIFNQTWMAKNLSTDVFNDGTSISYSVEDYDWSQNKPSYCYWLNDPSYDSIYGKLYNWYAVETNKLCPEGFRVPTVNDFIELEYNLKDSTGAFLKAIGYNYWIKPNKGASDKYGFNARPGQLRWYNGYFWPINSHEDQSCNFWTSSIDKETGLPIYISILNNAIGILYYRHSKNIGFSIRCIKN